MMRKILIGGIVFLYVLSTALQSSVFRFGGATVSAAGPVSRTNLVAVVVDSNIYGAIQGDLGRYANTYVPKQSPGTKLITIPLDPAGFRSDEVHRVLENLYFEGHKDDSTNLVGVIIFGDVPLPTVEVDGETFKSIHPYTDFENQPMFNYDPGRGVWTSRGQSFSQPELRHALIPGTDTGLFSKFFAKLKEYDADPLEYAEPQIWYDDYQLMQSTFTKEQLDEYINTLIFAEDRSYRRINRTMTDVMNEEYADDLVEDIERINQVHAQLSSQPNPDNASNPEVDEASAGIFAGTKELLEFFDPDEVAQTIKDASDSPVPTLINAKQIENNFRPVFALFGDEYLSTMEDNLAAGGRYDLDTIDTTLEKIQIKDQIAIQYIKDMNTLLEQSLDEKIQQEQYMLKYPLPTWYEQRESADLFECAPDSGAQLDLRGDFGIGPSANRFMSERYENFYFGRYAGDVQQYDDLHVYRGDWYNADEAELLASSIPVRQIEDIPFDFSQAAVGGSYGGFAQQTRSMRGTNFDLAPYDVELYDQFKCDEGDTIELWTKQYRGGGSPLNIDDQKLLSNPTDVDFKPSNYDESYMRHPTTNRTIGGPQYDPVGSTLMQADIFGNGTQAFDVSPSISQSVLFTTQQAYENGECIPLPQTDDIDNDGITNKQDDDIDGDGLTNTSDGDIDGDCIPNIQDDDIDGDGDKNGRDSDCNGGGGHCGQDDDDDSDGLPDDIDPDDDNDGTPDDQEPDQDNDGIPDSEDPDDDNDGLEDQDDPDDDNDGIPDDEELDSDGDGTTDDDEGIDSDQDDDTNEGGLGESSIGSTPLQLHHTAQSEFSKILRTDYLTQTEYLSLPREALAEFMLARRSNLLCEQRVEKSYSDLDFFEVRENEKEEPQTKKVIAVSQNPYEIGGGVDRFQPADTAHPFIDDQASREQNRYERYPEQKIPDSRVPVDVIDPIGGGGVGIGIGLGSIGSYADIDEDTVPNLRDPDIDGDGYDNEDDIDIDGDLVPNLDDDDIDGDGQPNRGDNDTDGDGLYNDYDGDDDQDGLINHDRNTDFSEQDPNKTKEEDYDTGGCKCGGGGSCGRCNKQRQPGDEEVSPEEEQMPQLSNPREYEVEDDTGAIESLGQNFDSEYFVIQLSDSDCTYCTDLAASINSDLQLQDRLTNSCDYMALVSQTNLPDWMLSVGGDRSFVGGKSREIVQGIIWQIETLFADGQSAGAIPHVFIVDQNGTVLSRAEGDLPPDLTSYCPLSDTTAEAGFDLQSVFGTVSTQVYAQGLDIPACIPLPQTNDIDNDGLTNKQDDDIDGDGLTNTSDGDIDGDCIPNTQDDDIDGDGDKNGRDSDCNGGGGHCGQDDDDDSDGLPDDIDPDDDNDGTPDDQEPDQDNDGIPDSEDPDDDNDGLEDQDDPDDDNDGIPDDEELDSDGDGTTDDDEGIDPDQGGSSTAGTNGSSSGGGSERDEQERSDQEQDPDGGSTGSVSAQKKIRAGIPYKAEVRENSCLAGLGGDTYLDRDYRDYHIIDTVVQHKAPTNHDLQQSTVLTMERAIDDPRYTTFHGIGGDLVKLVYPDIYNVTTYNQKLLTEKEIEENLKTYLAEKVQQYNKELDLQLSKSSSHYAQHPDAFDFLGEVHSSATPNRAYQTLPSTYFEDILGQDQITRLAHSLYYLSYPRETKPTGATVDEYIHNARDTFDIDRKLEYVHEIYLTTKTDEPNLPENASDDSLRLPTYLDPERKKAYEVVYINSDSNDAIPLRGQELEFRDGPDLGSPAPVDVGSSHYGLIKATQQAADDDAACDVPPEGAVPLLKRPAAFACWVKQTLQKPVDFELQIEIDTVSVDDIQNMFSSRFANIKDIAPNDASDTELGSQDIRTFGSIDSSPTFDSAFDSIDPSIDSVSAAGLVYAQSEGGDARSATQYVSTNILPYSTIDLQDPGELQFQLATDRVVGDVDITLSSSGVNSLIINGQDITQSPLGLTLNLDGGSQNLPLSISGDTGGEQIIDVTICQQDVCSEMQQSVYLQVAGLEQVSVVTPTQQFMSGGVFPFMLEGVGSDGGSISLLPSTTTLQIQGGVLISGGLEVDSMQLYTIDDTIYYVRVDDDASDVTLRIGSVDQSFGRRTIPVADVQIQTPVRIDYTLPDASVGFVTQQDGKTVLADERLPSIQIQMGGVQDDFVLPITLDGASDLVSIGSIDQEGFFTESSEFVLQGPSSSITLLPTGTAGTDEIVLNIPGRSPKILPLTINPSDPDTIRFDIPTGSIAPGDEISVEVEVRDSRGNLFLEPTEIDLEATGGRELGVDAVVTSGGSAVFTGQATKGGGCGCSGSISSKNNDSENDGDDADTGDDESQDPSDPVGVSSDGAISFDVQKVLRPENSETQDLNGMYVNLYGTQRGDQQKIVDLLKNEKTLAITTTRALPGGSELETKKSTITADGTRNDDLKIIKNMILEGEHVWVELGYDGGEGRIYMGTTSDLGLSIATDPNDVAQEQKTDVQIKTISSSCSQKNNKVYVNKKLVGIDFETGFVHPDVHIVPDGPTGNTWIVNHINEPIASFQLRPQSPSLRSEMSSQRYFVSARSTQEIEISFKDTGSVQGSVGSSIGILAAGDPNQHVGFRHNFNGITNFSQGQAVGPANQYYADPKLINFGDPFLKRIDQSPMVEHTDFDAGIGQQIYASTEAMNQVATMDADADGQDDIVIGYSDGSIRFLKNYGGGEPYTDLGSLMIVADGLQNFWPGDVDGDGDDDLMVLTHSDKLRVYKNNDGVMEIDGRPVCLDIPNGEYSSVGQTNQLFVQDVSGNNILDIVSYAVDGEIEIFYGGGDSYISTDPNKCDDGALTRNNKNLLKSMKLTAGESFSDNSLIHRSGLDFPAEEDEITVEGYERLGEEIEIDIPAKLSGRKETDAFVKKIKQDAVSRIDALDLNQLIEDGKSKTLDYLIGSQEYLRPPAQKSNEQYAFMRAQDTLKSDNAVSKVTKTLVDQNGGYVEKGDLLTVQVNVAGGSEIDYLEKLDLPVIIFKDSFNKIQNFQNNMGGTIDWNIGNGYEFMIQGGSSGGFSYEVMYNGNGHARIEVESEMEDVFDAAGVRTTLFGGSPVYAQGGHKTIKVIPDDACYKGYFEFDPTEKIVDHTEYYDQEMQDANDFVRDRLDQTQEDITQPDLAMIKRLVGIHEVDFDPELYALIDDTLGQGAGAYAFQTQSGISVEIPGNQYVEWAQDALVDGMNAICKGKKFGESNCGGLPIPFNMAFLAPGTYNVFGCKLADDKGVPILAFPTTPGPLPVPIFPPSPRGAGGVRGGNVSQFRTYLSPTLTAELGIAVCFGPYQAGMNIKSPIGDIGGNCMVLAAALPNICDDGSSKNRDENGETKSRYTQTLPKEMNDLKSIGSCDPIAQKRYPFVSSATGGRTVVSGKPRSVVVSEPPVSNYAQGSRGQDFLSFDTYTIEGGTEFNLEIEGGNVKGLMQCMARKRFDKQIRYVANNLMSMQVNVIFPDLEDMTEGMGEFSRSDMSANIKENWVTFDAMVASNDKTLEGSRIDPDKKINKLFMPRSITQSLSENFSNPFDEFASIFESIPLINVKQRRVRMQIPRLFEEDILKLELQRTAWIDRNEQILAAWKELDLDDDSRYLRDDMEQQLQAVRRNIRILNTYKELPSKLSSYIHSWDKYIESVYDFADDMVHQLTGWMQNNARRYSRYVDTIIVMIGIIDSRQGLIDFSTDRKTKCAKCSVDNYDYYSCKLSMLCIDLPLLPIPSFRIPDITLDLSQINLGMDILIPKFVFLPEKIQYPRLPDFPDPQDYGLNIDIELPIIPQLPPPPPLPDLPDLEITADLDLPILPPPPKIPNIFPAIKVVIEAADLIGTIFCIFKGGIGLVAEQSVKTRIEHLTQRTRNVEPFDSISITLPEHPLEGFDFKIDALVDLEFSFDLLYDVFDTIADKVNEGVADGIKDVTKEVANFGGSLLNDSVGDFLDGAGNVGGVINDGIDLDLELDLSQTSQQQYTFDRPEISDPQASYHQQYHPGGEVEEVKSRLISELEYMAQQPKLESYAQRANNIISLLRADTKVAPNILGVQQAGQELQKYIATQGEELDKMQDMLSRDFDAFVRAYVPEQQLVDSDNVGDDEIVAQFGTHILDADPDIIARIQGQDHPAVSYINYQKDLISGYHRALGRYTPQDLKMDPLIHESASHYMQGLMERFVDTDDGITISTDRRSQALGDRGDRVVLAQTDTRAILTDKKSDLPDDTDIPANVSRVDEETLFTTQQAYENGECIPLPQTNDIDNDGLTNKQDDDIDGDGLINTSDGDIDGDCIPNTQDDDIDGDGDKNGRDSDCNGGGGHCGQDDDDDSDGLPDDIDPDDDNDGTPDDQEPDQDNDGIPDSEDPDDDNDGLEDQDDPDDDNDGIPDDEELDSDGDGTTDDDEGIDSDQDGENNNGGSGDGSGGSAGGGAIPNFAEKYKEGIEQVDMTAFIEGFFVPGEDDKYHNIIGWTEKAESIFDSKNYSFVDLNEDGETDVLMRDKHSIFVKYAKQNNDYASSGETGLVQLGSRGSAAQLQEAALDNDGYINDYKVRDEKQVRFDFRREGNNYDSMGFSRNNTTEDAYVVSLTHKVDVHNNSDGKVNAGGTGEKVTYLLSLPQGMSYTGLQLELPEELDKGSIEDYVEDGTILAVNYFDGRADRINALLENVPAEWYFTKVSALRLGTSGGGLFRAAKKDTYKKIGPRSRQVIAGAQKRGDDARPTLSLELIRNTTQETISQGTDMGGFVLTEYTLSGEWLDNGEVLENRIMYDDQVIFAEKDDDLVLENLYYRYPTVEKFVMGARDQAGNEIEVGVLLDITSPSLQIVDIKEQSVGFDIHAQLSDTIDDGQVVFMNDRYGRYEKLSPSNYPVKPTDPLTIGGLYVTDDSIGMRDTNGIDRASINKDTGEITVDESDTTDIRVNFATSQAEISVIDTQTQQKIFDVSLRADALESLTLLQGAYTQTPIQSSAVGPGFVGGYCVGPIDDECHIYIDKQGNATIPPPYNTEYIATYNFDAKNNTVVYTLQDLMNTEVLSIGFVPQPLE